jgi:hypothetical protein
MKAVEVTGSLDEKGQLSLDYPIEKFPLVGCELSYFSPK